MWAFSFWIVGFARQQVDILISIIPVQICALGGQSEGCSGKGIESERGQMTNSAPILLRDEWVVKKKKKINLNAMPEAVFGSISILLMHFL